MDLVALVLELQLGDTVGHFFEFFLQCPPLFLEGLGGRVELEVGGGVVGDEGAGGKATLVLHLEIWDYEAIAHNSQRIQ